MSEQETRAMEPLRTEYSILMVTTTVDDDDPTESPTGTVDVCITGIKDEDTAIALMNRWIDETVDGHNRQPMNKTDPQKYYADHGIKDEHDWLTTGHIFYMEDGKRHDVAKLYIAHSYAYVPEQPLPDMTQVADFD